MNLSWLDDFLALASTGNFSRAALGPGAPLYGALAFPADTLRQRIEEQLGWPARSGKLVLKLALERVADFYRIK